MSYNSNSMTQHNSNINTRKEAATNKYDTKMINNYNL